MQRRLNAIKIMAVLFYMILTVAYIGSFFLLPFSDWDTAFYPLIGKGIFQYHILPYGYVFDHKPFLVNIFYYLWCQIEPFMNGRFTILALVSMGFTAFMLSRFYKTRFWPMAFFLFLGGILGNYLTGNTEILQIPIILIVIILMTKSIEEKNKRYFFISGLLTAVSVNINYLTGCILAPLFLYTLFSGLCGIFEFLIAIGGGLLGLVVIFMPFLVAGHGKLTAYFTMQSDFLHHYGAAPQERLHTLVFMGIKIAFLLPVIFFWFRNKQVFWGDLRARMLTLWFLCSVAASNMSGHAYSHYALLFLIPAMTMCTILYQNGRLSSFWPIAPLCVYSAVIMTSNTKHNILDTIQTKRSNAEFVSRVVGNKKVLNIRSDQSLYYLANLETFDPFLFQDHIDIHFGEQATEHYMQDLQQKPPFVLMQYRACITVKNTDDICQWVNTHYHLVYTAYNPKAPLKVSTRSYELYEINK